MSLMVTIDDTRESWVFDSTERLTRALPATLTAHPVERSADVTDHVQRGQLRETFTVLVNEVPKSTDADTTLTGPERIERCVQFLGRCFGKTLTLTHPLRSTLQNMLLASVNGERSVQRSESFTLEFAELTFAEVTSVRVPPSAPIAGTTAASSLPDGQDLGQQATTTTAGATGSAGAAGASSGASADARDRSYLLQLVQSAGYLQ
jgi:hypothetical protein